MSAFSPGGIRRALALLFGSLLVCGAAAAQSGPVSKANIEAELVRRSGGEWVIVNMTPTTAALTKALLPPAVVGLGDALQRYQEALEDQDIDRVASVWVMNPAERALLQRFFDQQNLARVSLDWSVVEADADRAVVRFVQQLWASSLPAARYTRARGPRLSLAARDEFGSWTP